MRNIILSDFESYLLRHATQVDGFCCHKNILFVYGSGYVYKYEKLRDGSVNSTLLCNVAEVCTNDKKLKAILLSYSPEKDTLYVFLENGCIVSLEILPKNADIVGSVNSGIRAASWSPGEELIAVVTGSDTVMVMSNGFDALFETKLHSIQFGEQQFVVIGWGKKETQFHGSEGKSASKATKVQSFGFDDQKIRISWRGDGSYFAVSCINPLTKLRYIKMFNREGILQFTSEDIPGLESSLDWQPSGSLIATTQRLPNKHQVIFLEKNGLCHGNFTLPFKRDEMIVKEVKWSPDSKLLALLMEEIKEPDALLPNSPVSLHQESGCFDCVSGLKEVKGQVRVSDPQGNVQAKKMIQIYTMKNYHWYCKYSIELSETDDDIMMLWDNTKENTLYLKYKEGNSYKHVKYSWLWTINRSKGANRSNEAIVAVIDGPKILMTSFKAGIIPPPMCTYSIDLPMPANSVKFSDNPLKGNDLLIQLLNGEVLLCEFKRENTNKQYTMKHDLIKRFQPCRKPDFLYNIQWPIEDLIICCKVISHHQETSKVFLSTYKLNTDGGCIEVNCCALESPPSLLSVVPGEEVVIINDNNGKLLLCQDKEGKYKDTALPQESLNLIDLDVLKKNDESLFIFSLDKLNRFFLNGRSLANNITSFMIHEEFLLLTSLRHELLCLHLASELDTLSGLGSDVEKKGGSTRRVERGSRLVTSHDTKVVLQMPRGNLECIQPRALSLFLVGQLLDSLQYRKVFDMMRKERINLNVIYDHNPELFSANVDTFISTVEDPAWISLFLSDLMDENVTDSMYSAFYRNKKIQKQNDSSDKVSVVCELVEKALSTKANSADYLVPLLTTYIKRRTVEYQEKALLLIKEVKEKEARGEKPSVTADAALKYMTYLTDIEELYNVALGLYDFDLVLLVAAKSQKDPKDYLPYLNDLRKLDGNYQRYRIDLYLRRYEKALRSLALCEDETKFEECLDLIKVHNLYKVALTLYQSGSEKYCKVATCYGEELIKKQCFEEAGMVFSNCGLWKSAVSAFKKSGNWQDAIFCAQQLKLSEEKLSDLYKILASDLANLKRFEEAATILMDYLKDVDGCLGALCQGRHYQEAFRLAHLHDRRDAILTLVMPGLMEYHQLLCQQIVSYHTTFLQQYNRLTTVRAQKLLIDTHGGGDKEQDTYSDTSTIVTQSYTGTHSTARTFRSSKNRRKQERKLLSLKEGSPYEDLALITSLHEVVTNSWALQEEVQHVNRCLLRVCQQQLAEELQQGLEVLLKDIEKFKGDIWNMQGLRDAQSSYGPDATSNSIAAMFQKKDATIPPSLLQPTVMFPPTLPKVSKWKFDILDK